MTTKFVEVTISHKYRVKDDQGRIAGGPMYFMERGLPKLRLGGRSWHVGKWLAVFFAAATVLSSVGSGNMPQSNNMASGLETSFGIPSWVSGLALATLMFLVIVGGIRRIAAVAGTVVPFMGVLYAIGALAVVISNHEAALPSLLSVFRDAFTGSAASGGFLGATFAYAFNRGVNRGLFSNEAGQGLRPDRARGGAGRRTGVRRHGVDPRAVPGHAGHLLADRTGDPVQRRVGGEVRDGLPGGGHGVRRGRLQPTRNPADVTALFGYLNGLDAGVRARERGATGSKPDGWRAPALPCCTTVPSPRTCASSPTGAPYTGIIRIEDGDLATDVSLHGRSLLHSVPLTAEAFKRSFLGDYGPVRP